MMDGQNPYAETLRRRKDAVISLCVHAGDGPDRQTRALETPLVLSSAFGFDDAEHAAGAFRGDNDAYIYGRWANPTVDALERKLAELESTESACATASGMAAIAGAVLSVCESGDHIVAPRSMYAESARLFRERLTRFGITTTFVDATSTDEIVSAITPRTRLVYVETPSNPTLAMTDIRAVVREAKARGLTTVCDNTFATPFSQTPLALGIDLVVHSMTKALGGHGDAIGGAVCGPRAKVDVARDLIVKGFGGVLSPFSAFLLARGIRTFALRQEQACATAYTLARRLAAHESVLRVHHPSLESHPGHSLARSQMHAFGSLLSFEVASLEQGRSVLEAVRLVTHAVSLGDVRSLLVHPASTTHSTMPAETRQKALIADGLLRLSVGIESADDLWEDLMRALRKARA